MTEETGMNRMYDAYQIIREDDPKAQYEAIIGMMDMLVDVIDQRDHYTNAIVGYKLRFDLGDHYESMTIDTYDRTVDYNDSMFIESTMIFDETANMIDDYIGGM